MHAAQGLCAELYPQLLSFSLGSNALEEAKCPVEEPQEESLPVGELSLPVGGLTHQRMSSGLALEQGLDHAPSLHLALRSVVPGSAAKLPSAGRSSRRPSHVPIVPWGAALWRPVTCS